LASWSKTESAIRDLVDALVGAWSSRDGAAFSRLFAEDADYVTAAGVRLAGPVAIRAALFNPDLDNPPVTVTIESIRAPGKDAAVILCSWRMGGDGRAGWMTIAAQRRDGRWQIIALQNTDVAR
jgi:uncharacterized protein (TIGR02246 family)